MLGKSWYGEKGYIDMIKYTLKNGVEVQDRTGVGCKKTFNHQVIYDMGNGEFPFSTIRPAPLRMAFEEFWLFMRGQTNTKILEEKGINFWKGNTSREFLDKRGLYNEPEGSLGKSYSYQWRNFSGKHDQLPDILNTLENDPYSRRMLTTFWNPSESHEMPLTPCWHSHLFNVYPNERGELTLNMKVFNRSLDSILGYSFAVQQYALYMMCMAELTNLKLGHIVFDLSDVHIYKNQYSYAYELIKRDLGTPGHIIIEKSLDTLDDMLSLQWDDITVEGLVVNKKKFENPTPPMAV